MERKEVYATSGPRIKVRFFGGWDFDAEDAYRNNFAEIGYAKGVPMGGDLPAASGGKAPSFLISAMRDPDGANLDRLQVIKGWRDEAGELHEKVYDVAWSGDRAPDERGKIAPVGSTVDLETATYTNSIGASFLSTVWIDPDFDPGERAVYYVRVLEIPTPRWTAFDEVRFDFRMADEVTRELQERAYTSPIWYSPNQ